MFRSRSRRSLWRRLGSALWPSSGWKRGSFYVLHRLGRLPGSPHSIAAGFACGAAVSFTPLIGMHFVLAALTSWMMRGSLVASIIGTIIGNPWTFPFIWVFIYKLGGWMGAEPTRAEMQDLEFAAGGHDAIDFPALFASIVDAMMRGDFGYLFEEIWPVWLPMLVGAVPTAIIAWFVFYFPVRAVVRIYQHRRHLRMTRRHRHTSAKAARIAEGEKIEREGDPSV